ncbi:MAG: hypothetical protein K6T73_08920 [Candidatus Bathyarchaeota archaeon]|nr:hypothetical protein [Candidatus Bathyarchaeota archaeon]
MSLNEIEAFHKSFKSCLKCGSSEGFWLYVNRHGGYLQCKHCGSILELCEVFPLEGKREVSKLEILRRKLRL